jgi:hypothetical protein
MFISSREEMNDRLRGNLGEFATFWIGAEHEYRDLEMFTPANAFLPLSRISRSGLDLLWMHFGDSEANGLCSSARGEADV